MEKHKKFIDKTSCCLGSVHFTAWIGDCIFIALIIIFTSVLVHQTRKQQEAQVNMERKVEVSNTPKLPHDR